MRDNRIYSLDLLRILSMFMIVLGHSMVHGGVLDNVNAGSFNGYMTRILYAFLYVHVNCFVLLNGYLSCDNHFSCRRLFKLWGPTCFWSILLFAIACLAGEETYKTSSLIKAATPIVSGRYWFMTTFILLYALTPVLNSAIASLTKKEYQIALLLIIGVFVVARNLVVWNDFTKTGQNHVMHFALLYLTGAYLHKHPIAKKHRWFLYYAILSLTTAVSYYVLPIVFKAGSSMFFIYDSITIYAASVCFFLTFQNMDEYRFTSGCKRTLSFLSPLMFGVYLIHDSNELRGLIWTKLFQFSYLVDSSLLIPSLLGASILVFICCCMLEKVRQVFAGSIASLLRPIEQKIICFVKQSSKDNE